MATPDLSALPAEDLHAIARGDLSAVSEPSLHYLAGKPQGPIPSIKPNTGLAGPLGDVVETAMGPLDTLASGASHVVSGVLDPIMGLAGHLAGVLPGVDGDKAAAAIHQWVANRTYHAVTPMGKAAGNATNAALRTATAPFNAAGNAIDSATGHDPILQSAAGKLNDVLGTAATVVPGVSEFMDAARTAELANPANVAKTGAEVADQAGYKGLQSRQDLHLPGPQSITNKLIADDAGLPQGQMLNVPAVQGARAAGPAKIYDAAKSAIPATVDTSADGLPEAIKAVGDTASTLPRSPDVDALKEYMLQQPTLTRDQLFSNVQEARERAATNLASDDPDKIKLGSAYHDLADAYEDFIGKQLEKNPNAGVTLPQFQQARVQFAKNYAAEAALKGGENIDPAVYGRILAKDPDLLTGNAKIVGQVHQALPVAPPFGVERGLVHGTGMVAGATGAHLLGGGPGAELASAAAGSVVAPHVARMLHNMFSGGDLEAAGATAQNPALSYHFNPGEDLPPGWNRSQLAPPPQRLLPAPGPGEPSVNAGGGASTNSILDALGLTQDVQRAAGAHPGAPTAGVEPMAQDRGPMPVAEPPLVQNWRGAGPDGTPNFSLGGAGPARGPTGDISLADLLSHGTEQPPAPGLTAGPMGAPRPNGIPFQVPAGHMAGDLSLGDLLGGTEHAPNSDHAGVMSQGVPEGIAQRTQGGVQTSHEADELGNHTVSTANGEIHAQENGPYLQVKRSDVAANARGNGEGIAMMQRLAHEAENSGLSLASDVSVSPDAQRLYSALEKRGFNVTKNAAKVNPNTGNLVSTDPRKPVFVVTPRTSLGEAVGQ